MQHDVAVVVANIAHAGGFAVAGDPAGHALPHPQLEFRHIGRQAGRGVNFQKPVVGVDEGQGTAGSAHQPHRFLDDELQSLLRIKSRMNDLADLVKQLQAVVRRLQTGNVIAHRLEISWRRFEVVPPWT